MTNLAHQSRAILLSLLLIIVGSQVGTAAGLIMLRATAA